MAARARCGIYGWGIVAPRSPDVDSFARNLTSSDSWLQPFDGFGPNNFLVGEPEFSLADYREWIEERFPPRRYAQILSKLGRPTHYAIGAFVQALRQNPGLEQELQRLGTATHVYLGTGIGDIETTRRVSLELAAAQREWDRFWAAPERNRLLRRYLDDADSVADRLPGPPPRRPDQILDEEERFVARAEWWHFWTALSEELQEYLAELGEIEAVAVEGEVEAGKRNLIKRKRSLNVKLQHKWSAPEPPWNRVSAELIWNIHNGPAAQVSMLGGITGLSFAPVAACSTFGVALKLAVTAIRRGDAKAVVVGATDPPPHPLVVGAFYGARVISADRSVSKPLTGLRGTHVAGGSVVWIVGDHDHMSRRGYRPLGWEPIGLGTSSDADHVITPSREGPTAAIRNALDDAQAAAGDVASWDLHATATPGDHAEISTLRTLLPESVLVTARKGTFGHGMGAGGGWELTAQYLGLAQGRLLPTPLKIDELHPEIGKIHRRFVTDRAAEMPSGLAGKLSMGIGGINACVISRPWPEEG